VKFSNTLGAAERVASVRVTSLSLKKISVPASTPTRRTKAKSSPPVFSPIIATSPFLRTVCRRRGNREAEDRTGREHREYRFDVS